MSLSWSVTDRLTGFLANLVADSDAARVAPNYYPSVIWSSGGWMEGPDLVRKPLPPQYDVGLVEKTKLRDFKLALPNKQFGYIIFVPKPEDETSSRRLIDYDGKDIVVR